MNTLSDKKCVPCQGGVPPLEGEELTKFKSQLDSESAGWEIVDGKKLRKKYSFENFVEALEFVNKVGEIAEIENHHPDITFGWGYAEITIWTHKINGLTESDFILAAKTDGCA